MLFRSMCINEFWINPNYFRKDLLFDSSIIKKFTGNMNDYGKHIFLESHCKETVEKTIDKFLEELEPLKEFILPTGTKGGQYLHLARTISRRAERSIVRLKREEKINENVLKYVNRLSDLLFVMARIENRRAGFEETFVNFGN